MRAQYTLNQFVIQITMVGVLSEMLAMIDIIEGGASMGILGLSHSLANFSAAATIAICGAKS